MPIMSTPSDVINNDIRSSDRIVILISSSAAGDAV